jgi:hypothetical protein
MLKLTYRGGDGIKEKRIHGMLESPLAWDPKNEGFTFKRPYATAHGDPSRSHLSDVKHM